MTPIKAKETKAMLWRRLLEAKASLANNYPIAHKDLGKASTEHMRASGVILTLTALGGREIISPVMIADGLSNETTAAIQADLRRSHEIATAGKFPSTGG